MNEKINLGVFNFDGDRIQSEVAKTKAEIDRLGVSLSESKKLSKSYAETIIELAKEQARLRNSGEELGSEYKENANKLKKLVKQQEKATASTAELERKRKSLSDEYRDDQKVLTAYAKVQKINIDNYTTEGKSISELRKESKALSTVRNQVKTVLGEESAEMTRLNKIIEQNTQAQKSNVNENQKRFYQIGQYKEQLGGLFAETNKAIDALKAGQFGAFATSVKAGFFAMQGAARAFFTTLMSNPFTATIAILGAFALATGAVVKEFWDYNESIKASIILTEQITKLQGDAADKARNMAEAYTQTFGGEFEKNLKTAKQLVTDFGISYEDAFTKMQEKTIKGADANGEFAQSINEYGALFKQRGYDADRFLNIIEAGADLGFYKDKLPDAIKEAGNELTSVNSKARKEIEQLFGSSFKNTIVKGINDGTITVKDALDKLNKKVDETKLNQTQLQGLTSSLFISAGEDGAGAVKIFEALTYAVKNGSREMTQLEQITYDLAEANQALQTAKDDAMKSDTILKFQDDLELAWVQAKTFFYDTFNSITTFFVEVDGKGQIFGAKIRGIFKAIPAVAIGSFEEVKKAFLSLVSSLKTGAVGIGKLLTGDIDGAMDSFNQFKSSFKTFKSDLSSIGEAGSKETAKSVKAEVDAIKSKLAVELEVAKQKRAAIEKEKVDALSTLSGLQKQISNLKSSQGLAKTKAEYDAIEKQINALEKRANAITGKTTAKSVNTKAIKEAERALKQAEKAALDYIKALNSALAEQAQISVELSKSELTKWIANNASKLEDAKRLNDALIEQEYERLEVLKEQENAILEQEKTAKEAKIQQEIDLLNQKQALNDAELIQLENLNNQKLLLNNDYNLQIQANEEEFNAEKERIALQKAEQDAEDAKLTKAIEFEEEILRLEEENATKFDIQNELADQNYENELTKLAEQRAQGLINEENYQASLANLRKQYAKTTEEIEAARNAAILNDTAATLGQISGLFVKGTIAWKAFAMAQATIAGIEATMNAYKTAQASPITAFFPAYPIVRAGLAAAFAAKQTQAISNTKIPKGYIKGGLITDGTPIQRENGDDVLITAKVGETILNESQQRHIGLDRLAMAGVPGFALGGRIKASNLATVQDSVTKNMDIDLVNSIREAVLEGSIIGTSTGSQKGMIGLSENREIAKSASHG